MQVEKTLPSSEAAAKPARQSLCVLKLVNAMKGKAAPTAAVSVCHGVMLNGYLLTLFSTFDGAGCGIAGLSTADDPRWDSDSPRDVSLTILTE